MNSRLNAKLLKRMMLGIASEKEKQEVFNSHESNSMLEKVWNNKTSDLSGTFPFDKKKLFQEINKQIDANSSPSIQWYQKPALKVAASVAVLVALSFLTIYFAWNKGNFAEKQMLSFFSGSNTAQEVMLPDGSKVILNKQTTLKYPKVFSEKIRRVELSGEAVFEVTHNPNHPFVVVANGVEVEVLGTVFNVMAYPSDNLVTATLISGKVRLKYVDPSTKKQQSVILAPNHSATFYLNQNRFEISRVDVNTITAWERGELIFNDEPIESLVAKLSRWYGTDITISNDLRGKYRLTMTIDNETIDEALLIISKTIPVGYTQTEKQIVIYPKQ
ncbi:MAG: FecR domain-containing protein [Bacteroidota bacterium]